MPFQPSSASRVTAGAAGVLTFVQQSARPPRYGDLSALIRCSCRQRAGLTVDDRAVPSLILIEDNTVTLPARQLRKRGWYGRGRRCKVLGALDDPSPANDDELIQ